MPLTLRVNHCGAVPRVPHPHMVHSLLHTYVRVHSPAIYVIAGSLGYLCEPGVYIEGEEEAMLVVKPTYGFHLTPSTIAAASL